MNFNDIVSLLSIDSTSLEAHALREKANALSHQRFHDTQLLLGQIGIEKHPCPAQCAFCAFSETLLKDAPFQMKESELSAHIENFIENGELDALFLMAMHNYNFEYLLKCVRHARKLVPHDMQLVVNIGDTTLEQFKQLKDAGVTGAYHVWRLGEGKDTQLVKTARIQTIENIKKVGLNWYYCCEPIGPEHRPEEIAEAIWLGNEFECYQHAAMARVNFPGSPLSERGAISKERLAQIVAIITLASQVNSNLKSIAVHEPDVLSLQSGANSVYAESGINPRDVQHETADGRGRSVADLSLMLRECGWKGKK